MTNQEISMKLLIPSMLGWTVIGRYCFALPVAGCGPLWPCPARSVLLGTNPKCSVHPYTGDAIFSVQCMVPPGNDAPEWPEAGQLCDLGQGRLSSFSFVLRTNVCFHCFQWGRLLLRDMVSCFTAKLLEENQLFLPFTAECVLWEIWSTALANCSGNMSLCGAHGCADVQHRTRRSHRFSPSYHRQPKTSQSWLFWPGLQKCTSGTSMFNLHEFTMSPQDGTALPSFDEWHEKQVHDLKQAHFLNSYLALELSCLHSHFLSWPGNSKQPTTPLLTVAALQIGSDASV